MEHSHSELKIRYYKTTHYKDKKLNLEQIQKIKIIKGK